TKTWLLSFVNQFFIDRAVAQISVLIYDSSPRAGSIVLNGATDNPGLTTRISNIPWPNSTVTNFDLLGAINYTTTRLLTRAQGWRNQSTIVIIVGISPTITTSCNDLRGNNTLRGVAEVLTLALNAQRSTADYLNCIEPFPGLGFTAAIPYSMLIPGGIADTVITNDVTRAYQYGYVDRQPRYPPIPLNLVQLDVVFVVDSTAYTTPAIFSLLQDMMVKFASQFTIGKGQTMFSVISYDQSNWGAGSFPLTRATDLNSLQRSIYALQVRNSSTIYQIDIAGAMDYVSNLILTPNQGHTNGRAAAVIILANTPNYVSLPNSNQIARLNSMGGVFGVDIPGQGASTYLLYAANFNDRNVLRAYGAGNLNFQRNFDQLTYFASSVYYSWLTNPPVPTVATLADIVIVMDSSQAVSQSFFNPLKQWLTTYVAQYSVGSSLTQFAIVFYDNAPRYNVINFNSATNGVQIQNALNGITFSASSQTNWDIRGAINYVASSVLTTQNGFRGQSAVVILASASASPTFSSSDCSAITAASLILARNATVLGLSLNPASTPNSYQSLVCAVGTANSASVYGAQMGATLAGTTAELQLSYAISLNYQKYVDSLPYDVPYPLISKSVDLVFLIDQSFYTYRSFDQLKQWLASYVDNFTLSNGAGGTQIAVVGVGRLSTAPRNVTQYIALNRTSDPSTLKSLIQFIEHDEETVITPDIDGALQFIEQTSLQPQSGRRPNVPAVTIILLGSGLLDPVQPSTAAILQGMSNVFGMNLYGYPAATNLLLQLTNGNDAAVGRMGNISTLLMPNNLPVRMLNSFISNSQLSWTQLAAADFVFVIDQTRMSSDDFISVKAYLTQLISQFQIGTNYSQFAVVQFAKTPFVIGNNIALNGATSNAVLVNRINSLPYIGGGPTATDAADLNGALAAVNNTYLMPSQGWRQNQGTSTFVVIIATASSATNAANAPSTVVSDLQAKDSYIYGFDAANLALRDSYLRNYYTPNVITLSSASSLTVSSSANKNFLDFVQSNTNAGLKQPCQRYMDVVIVLHSFSSQTNYDISIRFVTQLLLAVLPTDITGPQGDRYARVAFVVYHEDDVHLVFGLNSYTSIAQMTYAIQSETYHAPAAATTQKISLAYNAANAELLTNARSYATRNIILVTDRIDDDDRMDALTANQNARATGTITMGVGAGHMSGLGFSGIVSGGFVSAPDVPSMDPVGLYPQEAVYVVDFARDAVCQNSFIPTMTTTTTAGPTTPQFLLNMDLVIAIDVSTTMPTSNFNDVTTFITSLVIPAYFGSIGQGNPGVRIALVVVPGTSGVVFPAAKLNTIGNKAALLGALNSLNDFCDGSPGQALNRFFNDVTGPDFMNNGYRTNINNHLILYITGTSTFDGGNAAAISSAQNIRSQNTYGIITIAYTPGQPDADPNVLNSIAGGPNCVLVAKTVDDLNRNGIPFVQQILLSASTTGKYC
uniref:VWFA domain-containing protein n=1 Tax=Plectus sambesii TaxID=2011161 RepID=A0A914VF57_9BILA